MEFLKVSIDHAQPRLIREKCGFVTVGGVDGDNRTEKPISGYSKRYRSQTSGEDDTWVDPITGTLMLMPLPLLNAWGSTGTGAFARLTVASYDTLGTPANWVDHNVNGQESNYIHGVSATVTDTFTTLADYAANRAIYVSAKVEDASNEERYFLDVGWTDSSTLYFRFWTSGAVEVYYGGALVASENLSAAGDTTKGGLWSDWVKVLLIPMGTGILCYSDNGGGFFWEHPDIEPDIDAAPYTVAPAGTLFWQPYGSATVEFAPLKYRTSGYRCSLPARWTVAPEAGDGSEYHYVYTADFTAMGITGSFVQVADPATAYTSDGATKDCMVRIDLAGDADTTPFLYAAHSTVGGLDGYTDASEEKDITGYIKSLSFDVPESKGGATVEFEITQREAMESELGDIPHLETQVMRPVKVAIGDQTVFDVMVSDRPSIRRSFSKNSDQITFRCAGLFRLLERYRYQDFFPLDRYTVTEALTSLASLSGIDLALLDIEEFGISIGQYTRPGKGQFQSCIKPGDTAAEWWHKIFDEYLPDCHWCERPVEGGTVKLVAYSPDNRPALATPYRVFQDSIGDARSFLEGLGFAGEELENECRRRVFRSIEDHGFPAEANMVWVQGMDRRTRRPIVVYKRSAEDQDPFLPPSSRGADWTGDLYKYGFASTALATQAQCEDACERLASRLMTGRDLKEIEIDLMVDPDTGVPLWTGDKVEIEVSRGLDEPEVEDWTIVRFGGSFVREHDDPDYPFVARPCRYVLEKVKENTSGGLGHSLPGRSLREMADLADLRRWNSFAGKPENLAPRFSALSI